MKIKQFAINDPLKWISVVFIIKMIIASLLFYNLKYEFQDYYKAICTGDCQIAYLKATNNILHFGIYTIYNDFHSYTGRMPGYEFVMLFSSIFNKLSSVDFRAIFFIQILLSSISTYCLAKIAYITFKKSLFFYGTFLLYSINTYVLIYDMSALSESISISFFIFTSYIIITNRKLTSFLIAGLFFVWCIFLRQYTLPFLFLFVFLIISNNINLGRKEIQLRIFYFLIPIIIAESFWVYRNYNLTGKFIFLVDSKYAGYNNIHAKGNSFYFSPQDEALAEYISSWGGDLIWWNNKAEITAFKSFPKKSSQEKNNMLRSYPSYIYTSYYNYDSLLDLQNKISSNDLNKSNDIINSLELFKKSFIHEKPFYYYFYAPIRLLNKFLGHSGTYNISNDPWSKQTFFQKSIKLFYSIIYINTIILGFIGAFLIARNNLKKIDYISIFILLSSLYIVVLLPIIFRRIEYRHFTFSYPFFTILTMYTLYKLKTAYLLLKRSI